MWAKGRADLPESDACDKTGPRKNEGQYMLVTAKDFGSKRNHDGDISRLKWGMSIDSNHDSGVRLNLRPQRINDP